MNEIERERLEKRLERFERNADRLHQLLHDPVALSQHLTFLLAAILPPSALPTDFPLS